MPQGRPRDAPAACEGPAACWQASGDVRGYACGMFMWQIVAVACGSYGVSCMALTVMAGYKRS